MTSKMSSSYPDVDGNWQWPEKTWFRQRLNALKAQENEQRRKPLVNSQTPKVAAAPTDMAKGPLEAD
jgi:hypothetical protein